MGSPVSFLLILLLLLSPSAAAAVPGDFDGDGRADLIMVKTSREENLSRWWIKTGSRRTLRFTTRALGDAIVQDDYDGDGKADPSVVFVRDSRLPLEWYIGRNAVSAVQAGTPGDTPVIGDYDCDGRADLVTAREDGQRRSWIFQLSSGRSVGPFAFGKASDPVFAADRDGDGCDELFSLSVEDGQIQWLSRKLDDSATRQELLWGLPGDIPLEPIDLNSDNGPDFVVVRSGESGLTAFIRYSTGQSATVPLGRRGNVPFIGNFTGENWFGVYNPSRQVVRLFRRNGTSFKQNFGKKGGIFVRPDGSVVQPRADERFGGRTECSRESWSGGALWKPVSEGANRGRPTILLPTSLNSSNVTGVDLYDKNEKILLNTRLRYWNGNAGRATFDVPKSAGELKGSAPLIVRVKKNGGECEDRTVGDPGQRYD